MQENYKASIGISSHPEVASPQCSCGECDSASCFTKRRADIACTCGACRKSKSCLFYNNHATENKSGSVNFKDIEIELAIENLTKEFIKKEISYEFDMKNNQRNITRKQSRVRYRAVDVDEQAKEEQDNDNTVAKGQSEADACCLKEDSKANTGSHVAAQAYSRKEDNQSTAKLTAQVMDVPYKDYQNSLMSSFPSNVNKISALDIFNRIKEAYKACSCKFCECIVGKSLQNDQCNCKPCECNDCTSFLKKEKSLFTGKLVPNDDEGCPCVRCTRGSCKGIGKKKIGEAIECDCVGLIRSKKIMSSNSFSIACNCIPCQCIECKPLSMHRNRAVVVAPVGEESQQRNTCLCSPCECFHCGHGYGMTQNLHHEMSTSVNRHLNCHCETCANDACTPDASQSCRCERQSRVMSKPFQRDSNDYDIRRATVTYNDRRKHTDDFNYDTIAMFAAITNNYPKVEVKTSKKQCECKKCECLMCKYKTNTARSYYSSYMFEPIIEKCNSQSGCKCYPHEFCDKQDSEELHGEKKSNLLCACDVCNCLNCKNKAQSHTESHEIKKPISRFSIKGNCKCYPCECNNCEKLITTCIGDFCQCGNCNCESCIRNENISAEVIYPVKRSERLTPSIFSTKTKDSSKDLCRNNLDINKGMLIPPFALKSSLKKPSAFSSVPSSRSKTRDNLVDEHRLRDSNQPIFSQNFGTSGTVKRAQIIKSHTVLKLHTSENESMKHTIEPNLSSNSSMSCIKDSRIITSASRNRQKSRESSCNSSGHDCPSYLIHFPKTTVETCLNDILKFGNDKNSLGLGSSMVLSSNTKHQIIPITINDNFFNFDNLHATAQTEEENDFQYSAQNFESDPYRPQPVQNVSIEFVPEQVSKPYSLEKLTSSLRDRVSTNYNRYSVSNDTNHSNLNTSNVMLDEDYESVQNTLQEAREFSQQLVKLLEKYEKANKEFKSVSKKFKRSNDSLMNSVIKTELVYIGRNVGHTQCIDDLPTRDHDIKSSNGSSTQELVEIKKNAETNKEVDFFYEREGTLQVENNSDISNENVLNECFIVNQNSQKEISNEKTIQENAALLKVITEENEPTDLTHQKETKKRTAKKIKRNYCKMYRHSLVCSKRFKRFLNNSNIEVDTIVNTERSNQQINDITKQTSEKKEVTGDYHETTKMPRTTHDFGLAKQLKKSTTDLRISVTEKYSNCRHISQKDVIMIKQPMIEDNKDVVEKNRNEKRTVLKKSFSVNTITRKERVDSFTPLEKNVKDTVKSISRQPVESEHNNTTHLYENKALVKLHSEVKKLLDMPLLQDLGATRSSIHKVKQNPINYNDFLKTASSLTYEVIENDISSQKTADMAPTNSRKSCEEMKVNFLHVRRVSYHTLLVMWNAPRVLDHVEGYELLVDGRAVTKLLCPGRRMAVVTCFPYSDKILLTVRTVVSLSCGRHSPAATVIYQPRAR